MKRGTTPQEASPPAPAETIDSVPDGVDPRGPRFAASITSALLFVAVALSLTTGTATASAELSVEALGRRLVEPGALLLIALFVLFVWGAAAGVRRHPYGVLFSRVIRPRLAPPTELEPAAPPTFAQGIGALVTGTGIVLHAIGVPWALPIAGAAAFIAAFLNAAFAFCLGCELYLILRRTRLLRKTEGRR